jgi:hypothetical protein
MNHKKGAGETTCAFFMSKRRDQIDTGFFVFAEA